MCENTCECMFRILSNFYIFFSSNLCKIASHSHDLHFPEPDDVEHLPMFPGYVYFILCKMSLYFHLTDEKT